MACYASELTPFGHLQLVYTNKSLAGFGVRNRKNVEDSETLAIRQVWEVLNNSQTSYHLPSSGRLIVTTAPFLCVLTCPCSRLGRMLVDVRFLNLSIARCKKCQLPHEETQCDSELLPSLTWSASNWSGRLYGEPPVLTILGSFPSLVPTPTSD